MAEIKSKVPDQEGGKPNVARQFLLVALLGIAGFLIFKIFSGEDVGGKTSIPKAMQMTYVPADFKMNLDEQKTLEILSNPQRYKREFDELILNFNTNLVVHVSNRMGLNNPLRTAAVNEYRKMHPYVRQMYFNDFVGLGDSTSQIYQAWYENQGATAADLLNEVASKYTCFFITSIMATVLKTQDGKLAVKGNKVETPCGIALTEGLRPMIRRLQDAAAVRDFSRAKGLLREKVERAVTELAVMEVRDKKGIKAGSNTAVFGVNVSSSTVEITAISIMKIGYNLSQFLDVAVDDRSKTVIVTLPQPQILAHEVYPKVEALDIGWMREVDPKDFNENINKLRQAFRDDAFNSDVFTKARTRAQDVMDMILAPTVRGINRGYKVSVRFQNSNQALDYNLPNSNNAPAPRKQKTQPPQNQESKGKN